MLHLPKKRNSLPQKIEKQHKSLEGLILAINKKELPDTFVASVNEEISQLNKLSDDAPDLRKRIIKTKNSISRRMMKELKVVPKGYYQTIWMSIGMASFGIPIGMAIATALGNFALFAIGLPIGLPIGMAIGASMDRKAAAEGRQLEFSVSA